MLTSDFDYTLPLNLIAAEPSAERGGSRLLVLHRTTGAVSHRSFSDLPGYFSPGDVLVLNDSRVLRARICGRRANTSGAVELLLLERASVPGQSGDCWSAMARPAKKLKEGERILFGDDALSAEVIGAGHGAERTVCFDVPDILPLLEQYGEMPLPPYIVQRRKELGHSGDTDDAERYQTVFAREPGSVAAPTAGLHFSPDILDLLRSRGVRIAHVTLHVGAGTFKPVEAEDPSEHPMHAEHYTISPDTADVINLALAERRRIIAVGTTSVRTLESAFDTYTHSVQAGSGSTRLLILPGYNFRVVGALLTNFHLPKSTLLMLVSAFAGREPVLSAYRDAINERYRFYSYGDAMLVT
ncbi:MAG: tRNA preQ1(34) S-adenosylmethionine ribosyltransferase-isomerase QueA [Candidatus Sumerlaeaceae bacterium]